MPNQEPATVDAEKFKELRKPFPSESIGQIPKGGIKLDYVGHAVVTDRLLQVDPQWTWSPMAVDEHGLPLLDDQKNLWIELTVLGVSRYGVGDGATMKEKIGDALRNAAMRFGVALDLWSKDELESNLQEPDNRNHKPSGQAQATPEESDEPIASGPTKTQLLKIRALGNSLGWDPDNVAARTEKLRDEADAAEFIDNMQALLDAKKEES